MKIFLTILLTSMVCTSLFAQIKGETDMVSAPRSNGLTFNNARTSGTEDCPNRIGYNCGYNVGIANAQEAGLNDANTCRYDFYTRGYSTEVLKPFPDADWFRGYDDGWEAIYDAAWNERIDEKSLACTAPYYFDVFFCECICDDKHYVYDGDDDGYYSIYKGSKYACTSPGTGWKLFSETLGTDCNDKAKLVWNYNECGLCIAESGITPWYYDWDGDGYHSSTTTSCSKPGEKYFLTTSGPDCDDRDKDANITKMWYYFGDADNFYGKTTITCKRPGSKWKVDPGRGPDCDDTNPDIIGEVTRYYDHDGDGYFGDSITSCDPPEHWDASRWSTDPGLGVDCDDHNEKKAIFDACGTCGGDGDSIVFYADFDGDGYYSFELGTFCGTENINNKGENPPSDRYPQGFNWWKNYIAISKELLNGIGFEGGFKVPIEPYISEGDTIYWTDKYETITKSFFTYSSSGKSFEALDVIAEKFTVDYLRPLLIHPPRSSLTWYRSKIGERFFINEYPFDNQAYAEYLDHPFIKVEYGLNQELTYLIIHHNSEHDDTIWRYLIGTTKQLGHDCNDFDPDQWSLGDWYEDRDRDGYHNPDVAPIKNTCRPPDNGYVLLQNSLGEDCDDNDKWENTRRIWYYSNDQDNYYSSTLQSCENPGKGTKEEEKWQTDKGDGQDCDDTDPNATIDKDWYLDRDGDGFYIQKNFQCANPGKGTSDEEFWVTDAHLGIDCNDAISEINTKNACGVCGGTDDPVKLYVDLDGDGYHSVLKQEDCGTAIFSGTIVRADAFHYPESLLPSAGADFERIAIPNTSLEIIFTSSLGSETFEFPEEVLTFETLGLDCDDLNPAIKADGSWYPDADGDGYHKESASPTDGCTPPNENYVLLNNSKGADCDDTEAAYAEIHTWYKDIDGDGYFVDHLESCYSPGFGWSLTGNAGPDDDDTNPFTPAYSDDDFVIPSLLQTVVVDDVSYVEYLGERYPLDEFSVHYRGVELNFEDLIFDRVTGQDRLVANTLLSGREAPIYNAEILRTVEAASAARVAISDLEPELNREPTIWIEKIIKDNSEGYSVTWGSVSFGRLDDPNFNDDALAYFDELFDQTKFQSVKNHYLNNGGAAFTMSVQTFKGSLLNDIDSEVINEKMGDKEISDVILFAKKFPDRHIEFVFLIKDNQFMASETELKAPKGFHENGDPITWLNEDGSWKNPDDQQEYLYQLGEIRKFRLNQLPVLAIDYLANPISPISPPVTDLPPEKLPPYNYGSFGFFAKCYEFLDIGHFVGHKFKMPRGTWNPDHVTNDRESADRWKTKSPASLGGTIDGSLTEVREMADMVKLAKSLVYRDTWTQIVESIQNFNIGEQLSGMLDTFEDKLADLRGDNGQYVQYHAIGEGGARTFFTIVSGWKKALRAGSELLGIRRPGNPVNKLKRKHQDFTENFTNSLNKSDNFKNLSSDAKDRLIKDISESPDGELGELLSRNNGELVDSWKKMDNLGADEALRKNPKALDALNKPKGSRPDPSTYLDKDYIDNHLAKFDDGAVRFTKQSSIDKYGTLGSKEAFTMPKSEFDDLFAETGGDLAQIETKLGLNAGDLTGDDAVIAWVKKTDLGEVKIPSGNEGGVIDEFWIPGGKTSGGVSEAIIDLSNPNLPYTPL